jgi:hypothetical protein
MMARKPNPPRDDPAQSKRFENIAREIGADADADTFERAFGAVVKSTAAPPKPKANRLRPSGKPASS